MLTPLHPRGTSTNR